jgi:hypothetical protein
VPVLLIYSDLEPYDEARAQRVRADGRIKKPFGQDELLAMLHRFLPEAEEAAPPPLPPPAVSRPEPSYVTEPVDLAPEETPAVSAPELGALSESPAFAEHFGAEAAPEFAPPASSIEEALSRSTIEESAAEALAPEPASPPETPPAGAAEPMLVEETAEAAAEPEPGARTMIFRMPVQIAEPILADDLAPEPPLAEAPPAPPEMAEAPPSPPPEVPMPPETLEVAAPTVEEAPPPSASEEVALAAPPEPAPAAEAATSAAAVLDTDLVYWIVHNVVVRMAPPALPTSTVEELIRQIADEMINELTQPPPEPQS